MGCWTLERRQRYQEASPRTPFLERKISRYCVEGIFDVRSAGADRLFLLFWVVRTRALPVEGELNAGVSGEVLNKLRVRDVSEQDRNELDFPCADSFSVLTQIVVKAASSSMGLACQHTVFLNALGTPRPKTLVAECGMAKLRGKSIRERTRPDWHHAP